MNIRDSEIVGQLLAPDFLPADSAESADLILVNTCSVREKAQQKVYSLLGQLSSLKKKTKGHACFPPVIGLLGCVAQQDGAKVFDRAPFVDLVCGTQQIYELPAMVRRLFTGASKKEINVALGSDFRIPALLPVPGPVVRPSRYLTIMTGCNNYCSYCVVPNTRGREISRPLADILAEARAMVDQGAREIILLGQNVNSYGRTNPVAERPVTFSDLLRKVAAIPGLERLRFTTSNPKDLSDDLICCFSDLDNLCPHFHLPVQSGSDRILALMNRHYTHEQYLELVQKLRACRPDIALATDIIVGFPGESEDDFAETMRLLEEVRFHASFSFKYSDRPGTRSVHFSDKVPEAIKKERLALFQQRQDAISLEWNLRLVGTVQEVMVEECTDGRLKGRTPTNHIVHVNDHPGATAGDIVAVTITRAGPHSLQGEAA